MTALVRPSAARQFFSRRLLIPGLVAAGAFSLAISLLLAIDDTNGRIGGGGVLVLTTIAVASAIVSLVTVAIVSVLRIRADEVERARMHAMTTATEDGMCCVDQAGRLTYVNPAAERMLGWRFEDHKGDALADVFRLRHREGSPVDHDSPLLGAVLASESYAGRDAIVCDDGRVLLVEVRVAPIMMPGAKTGAVVVFADDTDRSREEQAKDDFVGFASHELRNPLTAMLGFSSWLARKLEQEPWQFDADTAEAIAALASETGRMESIIELFLDLTQIRMDRLSLEPDLVDVTKLLRQEGSAVRSRYPAATVEESLPSGRVLAIMDQQRLRQVILNLLDNAAKYGGPNPRIELSLRASDSTAEVRVKDFGSGIPLEDQQHVFERFFRSAAPATGRKTGFGIGLYVTRQIVDRMGGELSFVSEEGSGTEFTLRLPLAREEFPDAALPQAWEPALRR